MAKLGGIDYYFALAQGIIEGQSIDVKFGRNPDIDIGQTEDIWAGGGTYTGHPTGAAETLEILSDSANDTAAGTGARTIVIPGGLDDTGALIADVTVTLNGTTPVVIPTQLWTRANRAYVATAGSNETNVGTITGRHTTTTANVFFAIEPDLGQTTVAAYTVPLGKTAWIKRLRVSCSRSNGSAGSATYQLMARELGGAWRVRRDEQITTQQDAQFQILGGLRLPARTDIKVRATDISDGNTAVAAAFEYILIDD